MLQAQGTTLGADNGIGVATALALLDQVTYCRPSPSSICTILSLSLTGMHAMAASTAGIPHVCNYDKCPVCSPPTCMWAATWQQPSH